MVALKFIDFATSGPTSPEAQTAFRAGLLGLRTPPTTPVGGLEEQPAVFAGGPCECAMLEIERLPGLGDWRAAFETGRAVKAIALLLDQARAPASVACQFRDNLACAVMTHRMRKRRQSWDGEDTVSMFMELYGRVLGEDDLKATLVRARILSFVHQRSDPIWSRHRIQ